MNREQKAQVIEEVAGQIQESEAVFAVDYRGISVPQAAELRTTLRAADSTFTIVKNTLAERAADVVGAEGLKELLQGPTGGRSCWRARAASRTPRPGRGRSRRAFARSWGAGSTASRRTPTKR